MDQEPTERIIERTEQPSDLNALAVALAEAHKELKNPSKDRENPFFSSRYATLDALQDASRLILARHGLTITQVAQAVTHAPLSFEKAITKVTDKNGVVTESEGYKIHPLLWELRTVLMHTSGLTVESIMPLIMVTKGAQQFGSELTYMRRYAYAAILNMTADEDDDANLAQGLKQENHKVKRDDTSSKKAPSPKRENHDILDDRAVPPPENPDWTVADQKGPVDSDTRPDEIPGLEPAPARASEEMTLREQVAARLKAAGRTEKQLMSLLWSFKLTKVPQFSSVEDKVLTTVLEQWERVLTRLQDPLKRSE